MTTEEIQMLVELLELCDLQNNAIKDCNNTFQRCAAVLPKEHHEWLAVQHERLQMQVRDMHTRMMAIRGQFLKVTGQEDT